MRWLIAVTQEAQYIECGLLSLYFVPQLQTAGACIWLMHLVTACTKSHKDW